MLDSRGGGEPPTGGSHEPSVSEVSLYLLTTISQRGWPRGKETTRRCLATAMTADGELPVTSKPPVGSQKPAGILRQATTPETFLEISSRR